MLIYEYKCEKCGEYYEEVRTIATKDEPSTRSPCCNCSGARMVIHHDATLQKPVVLGPLTTDFGDGAGIRTYSRGEYIEKCKVLGRDPVGLTFLKKQVVPYDSNSPRLLGKQDNKW